jgi:hypothetical protein
MSAAPSLKDRLRAQREVVAQSGAEADDALTQQQKKPEPAAVAPPPPAEAVSAPTPPPPERPPALPSYPAAKRTQGIPISASDDALLTEMEAFCRKRGIKMRRNSNVSILTRAGWRLLHGLMERDPTAFAAAIEAGRPPNTN